MMTAAPPSQSMLARALLDPAAGCPPGLVTWNGSDPARRLDVHRNNVVASLVDALASTFPVVVEIVGDAFFRAMAAVFVRRSPPRSPVLSRYGADFPAFIRQFGPVSTVPYLADVARLEFARLAACHAADLAPVSRGAVEAALANGPAVGGLRLKLHPSVSLVRSRYAVVSIWNAHPADGRELDVDPDRPESALVLRTGDEVQVVPVPASATFIEAVMGGATLDAATQAATQAATDVPPTFDLSATLILLLRHDAVIEFVPSATSGA